MNEADARQWDLEAEFPESHAFIQWKGTDVCMDFRCECGADGHFDGFFAYSVKCPGCGAVWKMPSNVFLRKLAPGEDEPCIVELQVDADA